MSVVSVINHIVSGSRSGLIVSVKYGDMELPQLHLSINFPNNVSILNAYSLSIFIFTNSVAVFYLDIFLGDDGVEGCCLIGLRF